TYGLPPIASQITIEGNGATIARQANAPSFDLMVVRNTGNLTLRSVTLTGGSPGGLTTTRGSTVSIENSIISGNTVAASLTFSAPSRLLTVPSRVIRRSVVVVVYTTTAAPSQSEIAPSPAMRPVLVVA